MMKIRSIRQRTGLCTFTSALSMMVCALALAAWTSTAPAAVVRAVPTLNVGGTTYSNVIVNMSSEANVMLSHAAGMVTVARTNLTRQQEEWLGLVASTAGTSTSVQPIIPPRPRIPSVKIGGFLFSNVLVHLEGTSSVMIAHSKGMVTLNLGKLNQQEQEDLGLVEKPVPPKVIEPAETLPEAGESVDRPRTPAEYQQVIVARLKRSTNGPALQLAELKRELRNELRPLKAAIPPTTLPMVFAAPALAYLLFCLCFLLICRKAGKPAPLLVWIPIVQVFPIYRAANMSPFWFIAICIDVLLHAGLLVLLMLRAIPLPVLYGTGIAFMVLALLHVAGWLTWCFKIARVRGKSPVTGLLLLLPGTNILALAYLALSGSGGSGTKTAPAAKSDRIQLAF